MPHRRPASQLLGRPRLHPVRRRAGPVRQAGAPPGPYEPPGVAPCSACHDTLASRPSLSNADATAAGVRGLRGRSDLRVRRDALAANLDDGPLPSSSSSSNASSGSKSSSRAPDAFCADGACASMISRIVADAHWWPASSLGRGAAASLARRDALAGRFFDDFFAVDAGRDREPLPRTRDALFWTTRLRA